ncbi:hypothetical protein GGI01_002967 [Coemansia sp. RSA 376]|nr:hypothetical protein GGI01_002967 [Coemansia sp. RSA 376]
MTIYMGSGVEIYLPRKHKKQVFSLYLPCLGFLNTFEMFRYNREILFGTDARPAGAVRRLLPFADMRRGFAEESVLVHNGDLLPSTTTAVVQRRNNVHRMVLGSVMADHIAICEYQHK